MYADWSVYTTDCWKRKMHFHTTLFPNTMTVTSKPNLSPKGNSQTIILQVKGRKGHVKSKFLHPAQADHIPALYVQQKSLVLRLWKNDSLLFWASHKGFLQSHGPSWKTGMTVAWKGKLWKCTEHNEYRKLSP